ncbi:MAG TPA: type II toxin-antitoxin system prevent-host-death family antitoxin [Thermoanaerobaculia bacterium]|nr:type II toxin-antitoxin system prevent-host-death family antitoxin [Thermoanaerobaculia bacterium]
MREVGVKALKDDLSRYLRRVREGERLIVTDRGHPIALVTPIETAEQGWAWALVQEGKATWRGGKPGPGARPPKISGKTTSEMVLEDRR